MARQKRQPTKVVVSGTVNTIPEKEKPSLWTILSFVISVIALIISIFSLTLFGKQIRVEAAPKFGLYVSYYLDQDVEEYVEDSQYSKYGDVNDEDALTGRFSGYSPDRRVKNIEVYNEGAPLRSATISVIPYFKIYETRRIYDEEAKCPIGLSTDVFYWPIETGEEVYYVYRNGTSQGTIAVITDSPDSIVCINKLEHRSEITEEYPTFEDDTIGTNRKCDHEDCSCGYRDCKCKTGCL